MKVMQRNDFSEMADLDRKHMQAAGPRSYANLTGRALDLSGAIRPLHKIKPVLKSRYLVKGWLDRGASSVIYGESNVGKTFFALDLALHVAAGEDWHGNRVPTGEKWAGPVIYVACEGGSGINNRIEAMRRDKPKLMERIEDNSDFALLPAPLDLCTSEDASYLIDAIREVVDQMPSLIVVDTLARTMGAGDENTAQDMGMFIKSIDLLREATGAHVMVIHHSGKDASKGARGSGSLRAAVDTEIELTRTDDVVTAEARKQRDMPCDGVFAYRLKGVFLGHDEDGDKVTSAVVEATEAPAKRVRLNGSDKIALQALSDAIAQHGKVMHSDMFPANRQVVSVENWREMCDRHSLSAGDSPSAARTAFGRVRTRLQDREQIRIVDNYVWRVLAEDKASQPSQRVTSDQCDAGQATVTTVTPPYKGCDV
ncbi:helicase RepA family protein [Paracoccus sp. MBLB3053]|uniref:Helicase RepA family protein n=1 Tax=Paracoccus aurantius TaxID=3073814 RepID=A0ABU2HSD0_9RHOB|nr:helicase RepA family protein [Paracoccus sp. MBLB3053]MDS9467932.1 helicase RepA family protein [Paracoccus sp. MBLB3053]